jgi:hypothetical protein
MKDKLLKNYPLRVYKTKTHLKAKTPILEN